MPFSITKDNYMASDKFKHECLWVNIDPRFHVKVGPKFAENGTITQFQYYVVLMYDSGNSVSGKGKSYIYLFDDQLECSGVLFDRLIPNQVGPNQSYLTSFKQGLERNHQEPGYNNKWYNLDYVHGDSQVVFTKSELQNKSKDNVILLDGLYVATTQLKLKLNFKRLNEYVS